MSDKDFLEQHVDSLRHDVITVEKYPHLEALEILSSVKTQVLDTASVIDAAMGSILFDLPTDNTKNKLVIFVDSEWNVETSAQGYVTGEGQHCSSSRDNDSWEWLAGSASAEGYFFARPYVLFLVLARNGGAKRYTALGWETTYWAVERLQKAQILHLNSDAVGRGVLRCSAMCYASMRERTGTFLGPQIRISAGNGGLNCIKMRDSLQNNAFPGTPVK
ncbi:hypothetical protein B0H13DRAFT_1909552 [Mycena leptocephala]|nr:hypothetical protein B0H13DRAFT_1909552 [Mycena leptocephala]